MNGILNILKPPGMTSFDVVAYLRRALNVKKIGHTGTLDPAAAGVLPICVGNATKAIEFITEKDKTYRAEMILGLQTDTEDYTGNVLSRNDHIPDINEIKNVLDDFTGIIDQVPPMYSAVKVDGRRLYELARAGKTVERKSRKIHIYSIDIINCFYNRVYLDVRCSKGTYIRTLCSDIGRKLGCGACMGFLVRTATGLFDINNSITFEKLSEMEADDIKRFLMPAELAFDHLKSIKVDKNQAFSLKNGVEIVLGKNNDMDGLIKVYEEDGKFLGLANVFKTKIKMKKIFLE